MEAFLEAPEARWILRARTISPAAYDAVRRRVQRGLRFGVAARVEDTHRRVLLVRMNPATAWTQNWVMPGGGADPGETPKEAVLREVGEETGVQVRSLRLWKVYHETLRSGSSPDLRWDFLQYRAIWASGVPRSRVPHEIAEVRWFSRLPARTEFRGDWLLRTPGHRRRPGRHAS